MRRLATSAPSPDTLHSDAVLIADYHRSVVPEYTTCTERKRLFFGVDTYFAEALEDASRVLGEAVPLFCRRHAAAVIKPDAFAARCVETIVAWFARAGLSVVAARAVRLERHVIRAVWRYQWNIASRDRKDVMDRLLPIAQSVWILLRQEGPLRVPATTWLSTMKGPADPAKRSPQHLRYFLGQRNTLLNCIHTCDEPADMLREMAIYFDSTERSRLFEDAHRRADGTAALRAAVEGQYAVQPPRDLSIAGCVHAVRKRAEELPGASRHARARLVAALDRARDGGIHWRELRDVLEGGGLCLSDWEIVVLATHLIEADLADKYTLLQSVKEPDWLMRRPVPESTLAANEGQE